MLIIKKCFELSRNLPLDIVARGPETPKEERELTLDILKSHAHRVQRFYGTMKRGNFSVWAVMALFPLEVQKVELPLLTELAILDLGVYITPEKNALHLPRITQLSLWFINMAVFEGLDPISLKTLKTLSLTFDEYVPNREHLIRLDECTSLRRLIITQHAIYDFESWRPGQIISVPTLEYLHFDISRETVISTFMSLLHLPALTHLSIRHRPNPNYARVILTAFEEDMRTLSLPALATITLEDVELVGPEFENRAQWISQLKEVHFKNCVSWDTFFQDWLAPDLVISAPQISRLIWEAGSDLYDLLLFVEARMRQAEQGEAGRLEKVKVVKPIGPNTEEVEGVLRSVKMKYPGLLELF